MPRSWQALIHSTGAIALELLAPLLTYEFALAILITFVGGFIFGFAGFGAGLAMIPLLALLYSPIEAIILTNLTAVFAAATALPGVLPHVRWRDIRPLLAALTLAAPLGAYFLIVADPTSLRRIIGVIVLIAAGVMLAGWRYRGPRRGAASVAVGTAGGLLHGYVGIGGPLFGVYFLSAVEEARVQRAKLYVTMVLVNLMGVLPHMVAGTLEAETWTRSLALIPPFSAAIWAGARTFRAVSGDSYTKVALWVLIGIGLSATFS
jgi:uncharacterized membrane protein YfcA